jgi:hypothetical protein
MTQRIAILVLLALPHNSWAADPFCLSIGEATPGAAPPGWTVSKTDQGPGSERAVPEDPNDTQDPHDQLPPPPAGTAWKLICHDELDGNKLDESKWEVPSNQRRDGWWSPKAVSVDNGHLAISTLKEGDRYVDACVRTRGKFEHAHGYYVAE